MFVIINLKGETVVYLHCISLFPRVTMEFYFSQLNVAVLTVKCTNKLIKTCKGTKFIKCEKVKLIGIFYFYFY